MFEISNIEDIQQCCDFPQLEICDIMELLPAQYQQSKNLCSLLTPFMNQLNCMYQSLSFSCGVVDCSQLSGDALTNYGISVGFPRCQCDIKCGSSGVTCIEEDDIYCRLIQAHLISRQGANMRNLCLAIECLFGEEAFIISSKGGITQISSGRQLTDEEMCYLQAFKNVIPHTCGTTVEIFDIADFSTIVGVNCGSCNIYAGACEGASTLCNPLSCDFQIIGCGACIEVQAGVSIPENVFGSVFGGTAPYTLTASGNAFGPNPPTNIFFIDNGDGTWSIKGKPITSGTFFYTVEAVDALGDRVDCVGNKITVSGIVNDPPVAPPNEVLVCVVGETFSYTSPIFIDPNGDPLILTATPTPFGFAYADNGNGTYSLTGIATTTGTDFFSVTAFDGNGGSDTQELTINCALNTSPPICPPNQTVDCTNMPFTISGWSNITSLTVIGLNPAFGYSTTQDESAGTITIFEQSQGSGVDGVTITIIAQNAGQVCETEISISCNSNIPAPICPPNQTINCDDLPFTLFGFENATNITISGQGDYSVSPNSALDSVGFSGIGGDETVIITATNATNSCQTAITINGCTIQATNCPEEITVDEGVAIIPSVLGGFSGGIPPYTITASGNAFGPNPPTNMSFVDNGDGTWSITGKPLNAGTFSYDVQVTDSAGNSAECLVNTIVVSGTVNTPPVAPFNETVGCVVGQPFSYTSPPFTDADGDTLTLTPSTTPFGFTFTDNGNGTYTLSGTAASAGSENLTVTVTDGNGGTDQQTITVNCANV